MPTITTSQLHKLLSEFPCLVPCDTNLSAFAGFVKFGAREHRIRIAADCSYFDTDDELAAILHTKAALLSQRLRTTKSPQDFLVDVRDIVEQNLNQNTENYDTAIGHASHDALPPAAYYDKLLCQISALGWSYVSAIDQRMHSIDLSVMDTHSRTHTLHIVLTADFPSTPPKCIASLPEEFRPPWEKKQQTLAYILQYFKDALAKFQDLFQAMDDFDQHARILEPERPTRRDAYRRISLGKHTSIRIKLEPTSPLTTYPECRFLGSEAAIAPLRQKLNENMHRWDNSGDILPRENLQRILSIELPPPVSTGAADPLIEDGLDAECGICYTYRLEDSVPDVACDKAECGKAYHRECLVDWLRALPDTRESFGTLSGHCVYCEEPINVSVKATS